MWEEYQHCVPWDTFAEGEEESEPADWRVLDEEPEEWCQECEYQQDPLAGEGDDETVGEYMFADTPGDWALQYDELVAQEYLEWSLQQEHRADLMGQQATLDQEEADIPPHRMGPSFGPQPKMCKPGTMGHDDEGRGDRHPELQVKSKPSVLTRS